MNVHDELKVLKIREVHDIKSIKLVHKFNKTCRRCAMFSYRNNSLAADAVQVLSGRVSYVNVNSGQPPRDIL